MGTAGDGNGELEGDGAAADAEGSAKGVRVLLGDGRTGSAVTEALDDAAGSSQAPKPAKQFPTPQ